MHACTMVGCPYNILYMTLLLAGRHRYINKEFLFDIWMMMNGENNFKYNCIALTKNMVRSKGDIQFG